jgi:hypothetical protein
MLSLHNVSSISMKNVHEHIQLLVERRVAKASHAECRAVASDVNGSIPTTFSDSADPVYSCDTYQPST